MMPLTTWAPSEGCGCTFMTTQGLCGSLGAAVHQLYAVKPLGEGRLAAQVQGTLLPPLTSSTSLWSDISNF